MSVQKQFNDWTRKKESSTITVKIPSAQLSEDTHALKSVEGNHYAQFIIGDGKQVTLIIESRLESFKPVITAIGLDVQEAKELAHWILEATGDFE